MASRRTEAFDAFFASLRPAEQTYFLHCAAEQRDQLQHPNGRAVSLFDCLENVWDAWRNCSQTLRACPNALNNESRAIALLYDDPARMRRQRAYFNR